MQTSELQNALNTMILSASGWRKIFAESGDEQDSSSSISSADRDLAFLAAHAFAEFLHTEFPHISQLVIGRDSRPTGALLQEEALTAFCAENCTLSVQITGITAAPEIMAYSRSIGAAFMYISASHNPIGHNGIKFGLSSGGVLNGSQSAQLIDLFTQKCRAAGKDTLADLRKHTDLAKYRAACQGEAVNKQASLSAYRAFLREVITDSRDTAEQNRFFDGIRDVCTGLKNKGKPFTIIADFNGSARAASVDRSFFEEYGMQLIGISEEAGSISHGIVPEGDNLFTCRDALLSLHGSGQDGAENALFGYMPDCDGDRGIIIYWDEQSKQALPLDAQEVFALAVMAELSYLHFTGKTAEPIALTVNGPTSLRINEIAAALNAEVFYAEVGEANVVNRAEDARRYGYTVRILGEGSNGGNITYPAAVRDPLNTLFAIIKLLLIKDTERAHCPFRIWCEKSGQMNKYRSDFTLADVIATLPQYTTTSTQEKRALMHIHTTDHAALKKAYQHIFAQEWEQKKEQLKTRFGIHSCKVFSYNRTTLTENLSDFGLSGKGGLKVQFYSKEHTPIAFIWMRGSGTEPVFRIIADIKGNNPAGEEYLVHWQGQMVRQADSVLSAHAQGKDGE